MDIHMELRNLFMPYERKVIAPEKIRGQEAICHRIFDRVTADGARPLAMVDTYGCQQNEADSEKIRGYLAEMGYGFTQDEFQADVIVINTCAVREHAEMRVLGNVGALNHSKKARPGQIVYVPVTIEDADGTEHSATCGWYTVNVCGFKIVHCGVCRILH